MPVKWSWSFGPETAEQLNDDMGWSCVTTAATIEPRTTYVYSYSGSPTRYSLAIDPSSNVVLPTYTFSPEGWYSMPIYMDTTSVYFLDSNIMSINGNASGRSTYIRLDGTTARLYVDNTLKETTSAFDMFNEWVYFSLKYTMTGSDWGGQLYVNGNAVTSFHQNAEPAETAGTISFNMRGNGDRVNYIGQIILHDDMADSGQTIRYVTRVQPTVDTSENGTWNPSTGTDNYKVLSGSFDPSTYTRCSPSNTGNNVICQAQNLSTQIGTTVSAIDGITIHTYSSGTGQSAFAALSDNNVIYATGTHVTPSLGDTSYAFSTSGSQPSDGAAWTGASNLYLKYEVS